MKNPEAGSDLQRGAVADALLPFPQGFDPLSTQRVSPLYYFEISIFGDGPKKFFKAPLAPIHTNFERGARSKNAIFWSNVSKKKLKNNFFGLLFFKILPAPQKFWPKQGFLCFDRARKINLVDLKN